MLCVNVAIKIINLKINSKFKIFYKIIFMSLLTLYQYYGKIRSLCHYYILPEYFTASLIMDDIYVGDIYDAHNIKELKNLGITNVISVVPGIENMYTEEDGINHKCYEIIDNLDANLEQYFNETSDLIEKIVNKKEKVLIHCICGVSRSVTILIAYMIKKRKYQLQEAINLISQKRNIIKPNYSFLSQLVKYHHFLQFSQNP